MEEFTFDYVGLARVCHLTVGSVKQKSTQQPESLPPCVELGEGVRKKRIWLASTVFKWLEAKQQGGAGIQQPEAPEAELQPATGPVANGNGNGNGRPSRPPGRPRKVAAKSQSVGGAAA